MSKSKGNVVTPLHLLEQFGTDAVRYWAAGARPGVDTAYDEGQMKIGRRLAIKLLNASKFVLSIATDGAETGGQITEAIDAALLSRVADVVDDATRAFDGYDYARALERTETAFWSFCDDYLELVKGRAYGAQGDAPAASAKRALTLSLSAFQRLFAPFLPFATAEVWSWWQEGSVHRAPWPSVGELRVVRDADAVVLDAAADVLGRIRKAKTEAKVSMKAPVARVVVTGTAEHLAALARAEADVREAGVVEAWSTETTDDGGGLVVEVELASS
jgi:valyl-tRNA synthetase